MAWTARDWRSDRSGCKRLAFGSFGLQEIGVRIRSERTDDVGWAKTRESWFTELSPTPSSALFTTSSIIWVQASLNRYMPQPLRKFFANAATKLNVRHE